MTKTIIAALALVALTGAASAQSTTRSFYNSSGQSIGRATTSGNTTTFYDSRGRVTVRETTSGNTTTI